jgi:acetyl esterase/lipase
MVPALRLTAALRFIFSLAILAGAMTAAAAEIDFKPDVEYGDGAGEKLRLDLATPKELSGKLPAIIAIHGGGWAAGDKRDFGGVIKQLAGTGYVAVSINYRHAPKHTFPAQIEDSKCAVRWLRAHADELHVDPQRVGAIGASAGGHLAMILGVMDSGDGLEGSGGWADQSSKVQVVVSIFGPTNLSSEFPNTSRNILSGFIGGKRDEKPEQYKQASPIIYVNSGDAPMLLFQGTKDSLVPHDQAVQMADALTKAGVPGRVELLLGQEHGWGGKLLEHTTRETVAFFDEHLKSN